MFHKFKLTRCVRVFLATFVLACLFQFILIGLLGIFPNKFDFYHAIVQKQRNPPPTVRTFKTNEQLVNYYFQTKENEYKEQEREFKVLDDYFRLKALKDYNRTLISQYNWTENKLPYFFGKKNPIYPTENDSFFSSFAIWPEDTYHDRIVNQMMYIPENYNRKELNKQKKFKKILIHNGKGSINTFSPREAPNGQARFLADNCPVNTCEIVRNHNEAESSDAILFKEHVSPLSHNRSADQIWIFYTLESPSNVQVEYAQNLINWTATYRLDSEIVTPYAKFVQYSNDLKYSDPLKDYSAKKTKKVAWFVSNCANKNRRNVYAKELKKYFDVDIYGRCGNLRCPKHRQRSCFLKLKNDYKFYLSFENSNCKDYITEKFYLNALQNNIIPIVLGPNHKDYIKMAPYFSFIHVDEFNGVEELARFLNILNHNSTLYNLYFRWTNTGEFVNTFFWCRLCALLHQTPLRRSTYKDLGSWWQKGTCDNLATFKYIKPVN